VTLVVCAFREFHIADTIQVISFFIVLVIDLTTFLCCGEGRTLALVPANGEQLRANSVLRHEAVVVERFKQRDVRNSLLFQQIAQVMRV